MIAFRLQRSGVVPADLVRMFYAVAMAVSGVGSLLFGRLYDRAGIGVLVPLTLVAAACAPLAFLGGFWPGLAGSAVWGVGMGVTESIIPAADALTAAARSMLSSVALRVRVASPAGRYTRRSRRAQRSQVGPSSRIRSNVPWPRSQEAHVHVRRAGTTTSSGPRSKVGARARTPPSPPLGQPGANYLVRNRQNQEFGGRR
ncbi:MAG: hypothetical protein K6V73_01545 [Firmicutes bacterium]|nr:hypothetical protein [Bacillota bacterium]